MASSSHQYNSPHIDDEDDLIDPDDADLNDFDDPLSNVEAQRAPLTGNISGQAGASSSSSSRPLNESYLTSRIPGDDRRAPQNTIDETVWETVRRDLLAVWSKMREVLYPRYLFGGSMIESGMASGGLRGAYANLRGAGLSGAQQHAPGLRDWDLWGPLLFCLALSVLLSICGQPKQKDAIFSGVFATVWIGEAIVTLQIKLLGGNISFMQSVCIIGYTLFPLVIAALLSAVGLPPIPRIPVYVILVAWAMAAGVSILGGSGVVSNRVGIAVYPLFIFYIGLGCLCFIS
ncbi:hypothetical protein CIB48_g7601 [Xylaria polymorpha]|nr:hypothetical protein CIB48_g7601 [Xylaria polymorpha]